MTDELLPYYNQELAFIRRSGAEFARTHPKIAGRLRLGADAVEDPHVARLIESFAYLNARIRRKLDDDFPELTDALLNVLYPHYLNPIPSMAVTQFVMDEGQGDLVGGYEIPSHSKIETEPVQGEPCRFRTCFPVTLWPIKLESATLAGIPFEAPQTPRFSEATAMIRLKLKCFAADMKFKKIQATSLRFFLHGMSQHVLQLYELIFNNTIDVVLAESPGDPDCVRLDPECLRPVGFEHDEAILPRPARSFPGYRLLSEYFAFPEKFLFFDVTGLSPDVLGKFGNGLEIYLYLNRAVSSLEQYVSAETFRMGCTPIVNLFKQRAEPIRLTHMETEYRVVPDARRPMATEVHSIDRVTATSSDGETVEFTPFYSVKHSVDHESQRTFWHATRRAAELSESLTDKGTEVFLSLVDLDFRPSVPEDWVVDIETTCLNRDLPHRLPFGGDQPRLQISNGGGPVSKIICLTPPTPTLRPAQKHGNRWKIISHLSLGHLSITDDEKGADVLREILRLYDYENSAETSAMIEGILSVNSNRVVGRIGGEGGEAGVVCRGMEVTVQFDEDRYSGGGLFLFASVIENFLSLYSSINSFSQLVAKTNRREGVFRKWPPRAGSRILL